jgi:hypothetical protein
MRINGAQACQLVVHLGEVRETLDGDDCEVEVMLRQLKVPHVGGDQLRVQSTGVEFGLRQLEHMGRGVDADDVAPGTRQRHQHAPAAAGHLQHTRPLPSSKVEIERQILLEGEDVVQSCELRVGPGLIDAQQCARAAEPVT